MITYRTMVLDDIDAGLSLCRLAGWNQLAYDWKIFFTQSPAGCVVALSNNKVVGTVATIRYQKCFSWIGMVLVHPDYQERGIGSQLLEEALMILKNEETVKLDATPAGRKVYLKLGFIDEYNLSRMTGKAASGIMKTSTVRPLKKNDLFAVTKSDREIFGAGREQVLHAILEEAPHLAFLAEEGNELHGYCLGRNGYSFTHIGPVIAKDVAIAKELVSAALSNCNGELVVLDVTHFNTEWMEWLKVIGFTEQRPFIRMFRGSNRYRGMPEKQFAILGPEFG